MGSVFGPIRFLLPVCRLLIFIHIEHTVYVLIFRRIFLSNYWWQESDIWSQASYRYAILWEAFLDPSDSYFLFADLVGFYTHWTYMHIFRHIFLSNYWWQRSDIWSHASYRYPLSWEAFLDPSDFYFLFAEERGYHKWALAHSSSCWIWSFICHPKIKYERALDGPWPLLCFSFRTESKKNSLIEVSGKFKNYQYIMCTELSYNFVFIFILNLKIIVPQCYGYGV